MKTWKRASSLVPTSLQGTLHPINGIVILGLSLSRLGYSIGSIVQTGPPIGQLSGIWAQPWRQAYRGSDLAIPNKMDKNPHIAYGLQPMFAKPVRTCVRPFGELSWGL